MKFGDGVLLAELVVDRRSPHGERGLKYFPKKVKRYHLPSLPTRGAWIEIHILEQVHDLTCMSLPTRGAWIEMTLLPYAVVDPGVAPHTGSVD